MKLVKLPTNAYNAYKFSFKPLKTIRILRPATEHIFFFHFAALIVSGEASIFELSADDLLKKLLIVTSEFLQDNM